MIFIAMLVWILNHLGLHVKSNSYNNESTSANPRRNSHTAIVSIFLSKYSSIIFDYRCSKVDTSTIDLRRSTHQSPIFEGRHIDHRSSKVNTSISEGRHIDLRKSTHRDIDRRATHDLRSATYRSLKVDTSIIDLRKSTHRSSKIEGGNITPTIRRRILSTTALLSPWSRRSYTRSNVHV